MVNVSDLVRYCSDGGDGDEHLAGLELEVGGAALSRATLRALVAEARNLCEATSRLSPMRSYSAESDYNAAIEDASWTLFTDALRGEPKTRDVGC